MSSILYGMIHKKAEQTYLGPTPTAANYEIWVAHWFKAAEALAVEFDNEQLTATGKAVRDIAADQRKLLRMENETQSPSSTPSTR